MGADTTLDGLLNKRVTIEQPAKGFRVAVDTVLLAASVPAVGGESAVEFGCGVGGAMLCLAARVSDMRVTGIDIQDEYVALCRSNIARNKFEDRLRVMKGDVTHMAFDNMQDHVFINPPYHDEARHDVSPDAGKRIANAAHEDELNKWMAQAASALKPSGILTLIHRADYLDKILTLAEKHFRAMEALPILPKEDAPPKRVIVRMHKNGTSSLRRCAPLVLHTTDGRYTDAADDILRHAKAASFR